MIHEFLKPKTISDALDFKLKHVNYKYFSGGTILNSLNNNNIPGFISLEKACSNKIDKNKNDLVIGSMATFQQLIDDPQLAKSPFDILKTTALNFVNRNIRNLATIGGNIALCKSGNDFISLLLVMDSVIEVYTDKAEKKLITIPEFSLDKEKFLISKIIIPDKSDLNIAISKYSRTADDISIISVCMGISFNQQICEDVRLAIGGVANCPKRIIKTENFLKGKKVEKDLINLFSELKKNVESQIDPIDDFRGKGWFKKEVAGGLTIEVFNNILEKGGLRFEN